MGGLTCEDEQVILENPGLESHINFLLNFTAESRPPAVPRRVIGAELIRLN